MGTNLRQIDLISQAHIFCLNCLVPIVQAKYFSFLRQNLIQILLKSMLLFSLTSVPFDQA